MTAANRKYLIAFTAALAALVEIIDTSIVNVALTDMQASLGATLSEVSWVITSYAMANVIILPLSAWLGERYGKKSYFVFSLVGFTAASVLCGLAHSLWLLVLARVLQGLTGGGLMAKAQTILFETFPREEQGKAQAIFGITIPWQYVVLLGTDFDNIHFFISGFIFETADQNILGFFTRYVVFVTLQRGRCRNFFNQ